MAPENQIVMLPMTSNGHVTGNVVTWRKTSLEPDRSRSWHQYVGLIT